MKLKSIIAQLHLDIHSLDDDTGCDITGGYCSDLLSDVLAHANENDMWITMQIHKNIIAVAVIKKLGVIILVNGRRPEQETLAKAQEEHIPVLTSSLSAFELVGKLYEMGLRPSSFKND